MGMFDSVFAECPKCGKDVEFQSKAGDCLLSKYRIPGDVPGEIAEDLDGEIGQCECGHMVLIEIGHIPPPRIAQMRISN